jgi:hypothetical protein
MYNPVSVQMMVSEKAQIRKSAVVFDENGEVQKNGILKPLVSRISGALNRRSQRKPRE